MPEHSPPNHWPDGSPRFATTHWTVLREAGDDGPGHDAAMENFCRAYWYPVYAFVRRRGRDPETARDLTQAFFEKLLAENWLRGVERRETRFSTLLLTVLTHFLINRHERDTAEKRGGGKAALSIDLAQAEGWYGAEPATHETPEGDFDRRWALAVLEAALVRLREECEASGRARLFSLLGPFISREPASGDYESAAAQLGIERRSVAVAVLRLRREYHHRLREEVGAGLSDPGRIDEEMDHLLRTLRA